MPSRGPRPSTPSSSGRRALNSAPRPASTPWIDTYHARAPPRAARSPRVPHRQRRRRARGGQPPPPGAQPRRRRAARPRGAVPHVEAHAAVLPDVRRPRAPARVPLARRPRGRQVDRHAALRRARVGAPGGHPGSPALPRPRRLGQSPSPPRAAGGFPAGRGVHGRVLPDAGRLAPPGARRGALPRRVGPPRRDDAGRVRGSSTGARVARRSTCWPSSCRCRWTS